MWHGVAALLLGACAPVRVDAVLARDGDPARGAELWATHCASCHGPEGEGTADGADLTDRPLDDADLVDRFLFGWGAMDGFAGTLSTREAADVLAWMNASIIPAE